jgi:hypothetical protein
MTLKIILTQLARMKPTLPMERLSIQDRNKNIQESITINPLYLSSCCGLMAANTYASVTPLMALGRNKKIEKDILLYLTFFYNKP